ncbi:DDE-type integrase/transposase/recombinase [Chroococcidiopsis sp [FACHB-1243]]|uniref:DDE-type integrase/transposase/recombinase n=1 Tax=Chroococcidiopsis sp. [FACHB-1243] TaxID=2692781 RepID=UPI00322036B0
MRWTFCSRAKRDSSSAARCFRKTLKAAHTQSPRAIDADKNSAYPSAVETLQDEETRSKTVKLRQNKYLNNVVEQDHRKVKRIVRPMMGFHSFNTARRTLSGIEAMAMSRARTSESNQPRG